MRNLRNSWKLVTLFAVVVIVSLCYVIRSRAFTLIEVDYLPAVQLVPLQSLGVRVSNVSADPVDVTVELIDLNGTLLATKTESILAGHTLSLPYKNMSESANIGVRAVISLGAANSTVSDIMTFDKTTGQAVALLPAVQLKQ